ncbi:hypothetical protein Bca4012_100714 [Brassica carinata]
MGDKGFTASELESRDNRNTSVDNFPFQDSTVGEDTMILSILFLLLVIIDFHNHAFNAVNEPKLKKLNNFC